MIINNDYFDFTYCLFKKGLYICHVKQTQKLRIMTQTYSVVEDRGCNVTYVEASGLSFGQATSLANYLNLNPEQNGNGDNFLYVVKEELN